MPYCSKLHRENEYCIVKWNIAQKLNELDLNPDIELEWDNLKTIINDVAYDDVGTE